MEQWIVDIGSHWGPLVYLLILIWTFFEGETVVLVVGALISAGTLHLSVWLLALAAFLGSFAGDQFWFHIGRRFGTPLLKRWPNMASKVEWCFDFLRCQETLFILSFRFIYGLRNLSPFVIGMAGISRLKFLVLNCAAAVIWALTFAWGGFSVGKVLECYLGRWSKLVLGVLIGAAILAFLVNWLRQRRKLEGQKI